LKEGKVKIWSEWQHIWTDGEKKKKMIYPLSHEKHKISGTVLLGKLSFLCTLGRSGKSVYRAGNEKEEKIGNLKFLRKNGGVVTHKRKGREV